MADDNAGQGKPVTQAYCVKCREKRDIKDPKLVEMKGKGDTKRRALKGTCSTCGTGMYRILGKNDIVPEGAED